MKITDLLSIKTIDLNATAKDKTDVIKKAVKLINNSGAIKNVDSYQKGVFAREKESTTGVGEGIAIPHCKSNVVIKPALAAMVIKDGVDYQALDNEPVHLLFLIAAPNSKDNVHLDVLARLSNLLMHEEFKNKLLKAKNKQEFLKIIDEAESEKKEAEENKETTKYPKVLAVTSCPTGVAHTYMAQEALEKAAKKMGCSIKVETNGASGVKNAITEEEIEHAETVIVAADALVEIERFIGKKMAEVSVSRAIKDPEGLIIEALSNKTKVYKGVSGKGIIAKKAEENVKKGRFHTFYRHLMCGISHMIPFVVAGGILLAISYLIDTCCGVDPTSIKPSDPRQFGQVTEAAYYLHMIGADFGLGLMLPVLAGFIAFSISNRAGLVAGFIGGMICKKGECSLLYIILKCTDGSHDMIKTLENSAAGFLGAICAGFIAGYVVLFLKKKMDNVPKSIFAVRDILIIPLSSTVIVSALMLVVNIPISYLNIGMFKGLLALHELNLALLLAALVSGLMATDMGGPINKSAHYFTLMLVTNTAELHPDSPGRILALQLMAAHIVGAITPPVAIALSSWLFPQKYNKTDRMTSISNLITGLCGITEGAIPFAINDPVRTITSCVVGSAAGGMVCYSLGFGCISPEGGSISYASMGAQCWKGFVAIAVGVIIAALMLGLWRKKVDKESAQLGNWKGIPTGAIDKLFDKIGNKIAFKHKEKKVKNQ